MFQYNINKTLLPAELSAAFIESHEDRETLGFLDDCRRQPYSKWKLFLADLLSLGLEDYEVHGLLRIYPMHLISSAQWLQLIGGPKQKLLDVGAGQGFVTEQARGAFEEISVTETSKSMLRILRKCGFIIFKNGAEKFDVVSILNVLDRCDFPFDMLDDAVSFLKPDGLLLVATPLPFKPYVRSLGGRRPQKQPLPTTDNVGWEHQLNFFNEQILKPAGLKIIRFTRLPYIWKDARPECFVALDDAVMVCKVSV
jgi:SAM-dependent methyltransferase